MSVGCHKYIKEADLTCSLLKKMLTHANIITPILLVNGGQLWQVNHPCAKRYIDEYDLTKPRMIQWLTEAGIMSNVALISAKVVGKASSCAVTVERDSPVAELQALIHVLKSVNATTI
jgi:hypothetical protein